MDVSVWLPVVAGFIGTLLGWFLNQFGQWFLHRREEKRALACALSDLLEIRHRFLAIPKAVESLTKHFPIPPEAHTPLKFVLSQWFPADAELSKRYAASVHLVAAANPVLGFRLRSQDQVTPVLDRLRQVAAADAASGPLFAKLEQELMGQIQPHLEKLILELARMHGWLAWWRVRGLLRKPVEIPDTLFQSLKAHVPAVEQKQPAPEAS